MRDQREHPLWGLALVLVLTNGNDMFFHPKDSLTLSLSALLQLPITCHQCLQADTGSVFQC